jgi:C1A family cysteine protease
LPSIREIPGGTCVGFATVDGMKEYQEKLEWKKLVQLSVRYVYAEAKKIDGHPDEEGTEIRCAMKVLKSNGVPPDDCWKYRPHQDDKPCDDADELARPYRIESYVRVKTELEMKETLFVNGPFVAGVDVYYDAWTAAEATGKVKMPKKNDERAGGHAICVVGYDDKTRYFKLKNSWGKGWGAKGYGFLPYGYLKKYSNDNWSGKDLLADKNVRAFIASVLAISH